MADDIAALSEDLRSYAMASDCDMLLEGDLLEAADILDGVRDAIRVIAEIRGYAIGRHDDHLLGKVDRALKALGVLEEIKRLTGMAMEGMDAG